LIKIRMELLKTLIAKIWRKEKVSISKDYLSELALTSSEREDKISNCLRIRKMSQMKKYFYCLRQRETRIIL